MPALHESADAKHCAKFRVTEIGEPLDTRDTAIKDQERAFGTGTALVIPMRSIPHGVFEHLPRLSRGAHDPKTAFCACAAACAAWFAKSTA